MTSYEDRVPPGRRVRLPGRGTTFVREAAGPPGAPTVVLLHGLAATSAVNWPDAFGVLAQDFHVVALDQRGHGRGLRSPWPFRLEDCADDVVRLADVLGVERFIAVGYSMGGPVALLARRRHRTRVSGLVLCATSARFSGDGDDSPSPAMAMLTMSLRLTPPVVRRRMAEYMASYLGRETALSPGFLEEVRRHDPAAVAEAARACRRFDARSWVGQVGGPVASVITERDRLVPRASQVELARATGAVIHPIDADHEVAVRNPGRFLPVLRNACRTVSVLPMSADRAGSA